MFFNYCCSYFLAKVAAPTSAEPTFEFNHFAEEVLLESALFVKILIEGIALLIVFIAIGRAIKKMLLGYNRIAGKRMNQKDNLLLVRIDLGTSLSLSLEFLLAADIAATAVAPTWDRLGQLAAITVIRTFLNFFLQREINELQHVKQSNIRTMDTQLLTDID